MAGSLGFLWHPLLRDPSYIYSVRFAAGPESKICTCWAELLKGGVGVAKHTENQNLARMPVKENNFGAMASEEVTWEKFGGFLKDFIRKMQHSGGGGGQAYRGDGGRKLFSGGGGGSPREVSPSPPFCPRFGVLWTCYKNLGVHSLALSMKRAPAH